MSALAQTNTPNVPSTSEERATEFVPVEGGGETTSAEALLITAYLVMWVLLFAFLYMTFRRQRELEARLGALSSAVQNATERKP